MYFNLINNDGIELLPNDKNFEFSDDIVFIRGIEENMVQVYDLNGILRKVDVSSNETGVFISLKELSSGVYIINWRDSAIKIYK